MPISGGLELAEALASFAKTRSSELTPAIETLGRAALDGFVPPAPKKNLEFHRAWQQLALDPAKRTWCLETIIDKLPKLMDGKEYAHGDKMDAAVERLDTLRSVDPDPRIARAMVELYELRSPVMGFVPALEALAHVLVRHADDATCASPATADLAAQEEVAKIFAATPLPKPVALDAATKARAKHPDADGPREVLAGALQEAGDPRGEFIALQLREHRGDTSDELRQRAQELVQIKRVEVVNNATQAKELAKAFGKRIEIAAVRPPSGTITGVK